VQHSILNAPTQHLFIDVPVPSAELLMQIGQYMGHDRWIAQIVLIVEHIFTSPCCRAEMLT
jgi:hypothetical protein